MPNLSAILVDPGFVPVEAVANSAELHQAAYSAVWQVRLLGGFEIDDGKHRLTRLRSRAAMLLLARPAMAPRRDHGREELATLLWPQADAACGRSRLRQTLSLLRSVLEPPGAAPVVLADRRALRPVRCGATPWPLKQPARAACWNKPVPLIEVNCCQVFMTTGCKTNASVLPACANGWTTRPHNFSRCPAWLRNSVPAARRVCRST